MDKYLLIIQEYFESKGINYLLKLQINQQFYQVDLSFSILL